jgi:hypothetical protein
MGNFLSNTEIFKEIARNGLDHPQCLAIDIK